VSELTRRTLFAVVAAPVAIVAIYLGGAVLATILAVLSALGAWEFCRMARAAGADPFDWLAIIAAALIPLYVQGIKFGKLIFQVSYIAVLVLVVLGAAIVFRGPNRKPLLSVATTIFGVAYVGMLAYVFDIRYHDYVVDAASGTALVMLPILLTWATDVGAYFFGKLLGGKKLMPSVSPGKTISGAVGGVVLALVICVAYIHFVLRPFAQLSFTGTGVVVFAILVSVVAQIGDLAESLIKRGAGVKDSSSILPGHGGILDRFDSMLFVLPVAALLLHVLLIPSPV
jgi:phosphatidate cytidylyltransferase